MIEGKWFPHESAHCYRAHLERRGDYYTLVIDGEKTLSGPLAQLTVSHRLGNIERKIELSDGSVFLTSDNDAVDALLADMKHPFFSWLHKQESSVKRIFLFFVIVVVCAFSFVRWGLPWISEKVAVALPDSVVQQVGDHTFQLLDDYALKASQLTDEEQSDIRERFKQRILPQSPSQRPYALHFRRLTMGGIPVANAFALPNGDIVITDELVRLITHADDIDSVLLHEMGHIAYRHGMQAVTHRTLIGVLTVAILGQTDGLADVAFGFGSALLSSGYSRRHEREADDFAFQRMLRAGINPASFAKILQRIEEHFIKELSEQGVTLESDDGDAAISTLFSTHPATAERSEKARLFTECFEQGKTVCP